MPAFPGPRLVVAAVALVLFGVSAVDALRVMWDVRAAEHDAGASGRALVASSQVQRALVAADRDPARAPEVRAAVAALRRAEADDGDGDGVPRAVLAVEREVARGAGLAAALTPLLRYHAAEEGEQVRAHRRTATLTSRAIKSDGVGMLFALVLGIVAVVGLRGGRPGAARPAAAETPPVPAPARPPTAAAPALRLEAARLLDEDDGPSTEEVAAAVDRVRRQVLARYSRAEADRDELASIVDTAFDAFVGVAADGRIVRWNSRAEQLFGWPRDEAIGRPVLGTAFGPAPGQEPIAAAELRRLAAGHPDEPAELLAWYRSGRSFPVEVALSLASDDPDAPVYAFVRDITRRRALERRERAVHHVTRQLAECESLEDGAERVLLTLCATFGWSGATLWTMPEDAPGTLRALYCWTAPAALLQHWRETCLGTRMRTGGGLVGRAWQQAEVCFLEEEPTLEGDRRAPAALRAGLRAAVCLPLVVEGAVVGVVELVADGRRRVDAGFVGDLAAVEQVIASFIERHRARAATERAKREFLTLVSHELRTPLTSIKGYVQMLRAKMADAGPAEQRSVEIIGRNADRLHRLVGDLLFAAEISRGNLTLERGSVCLHEVVRDAADAARPAADARGIHVAVDLEPVGAVAGDAGRLSQVLDNLLSNAIKFSHEGGLVQVVVRGGADGLEVAVRDEGIGVAAADLGRVAQEFFRAGTARTAQVPGMGLGLALSRAIVQGHGGELRFDSVEGRGTTVTVVLPEAPGAELAAAA